MTLQDNQWASLQAFQLSLVNAATIQDESAEEAAITLDIAAEFDREVDISDDLLASLSRWQAKHESEFGETDKDGNLTEHGVVMLRRRAAFQKAKDTRRRRYHTKYDWHPPDVSLQAERWSHTASAMFGHYRGETVELGPRTVPDTARQAWGAFEINRQWGQFRYQRIASQVAIAAAYATGRRPAETLDKDEPIPANFGEWLRERLLG